MVALSSISSYKDVGQHYKCSLNQHLKQLLSQLITFAPLQPGLNVPERRWISGRAKRRAQSPCEFPEQRSLAASQAEDRDQRGRFSFFALGAVLSRLTCEPGRSGSAAASRARPRGPGDRRGWAPIDLAAYRAGKTGLDAARAGGLGVICPHAAHPRYPGTAPALSPGSRQFPAPRLSIRLG